VEYILQRSSVASTETIAVGADQSPYRVLAWWDVDMHIGSYKKRKLTARPLRNLERTLGHRLHVEGRSVHHRLPEIWKLEAYNYIDVADPALAAHFVLNQISGIAEWFSGFGYRRVTSTHDKLDDDTICTFYWGDEGGPQTYRHVRSGGVLLFLVERFPVRGDQQSRYDFDRLTRPRPVVKVSQAGVSRSNFLVAMTIHFTCNNRQKLIQHHWPKLAEKYGLVPDDHVEFGPQPRDGEPNAITILKSLSGLLEHEAVAYCLARTERCRFKPGGSDGEVFHAERFPGHPPFDGMHSISLTRAA
jgi:hypothetical protein